MSREYTWFMLLQRSVCDNLHFPPAQRAITFFPSSAPRTPVSLYLPHLDYYFTHGFGVSLPMFSFSIAGCLPEHHLSCDIDVTRYPTYIPTLLSNVQLIQLPKGTCHPATLAANCLLWGGGGIASHFCACDSLCCPGFPQP